MVPIPSSWRRALTWLARFHSRSPLESRTTARPVSRRSATSLSRERSEEFIEGSSRRCPRSPTGDPMDPATVLGPLVSKAQRDLAGDTSCRRSFDEGARVTHGRRPLEGTGLLLSRDGTHRRARAIAGGLAKNCSDPSRSFTSSRSRPARSNSPTPRPGDSRGSIWAVDQDEIDAVIEGLDVGMVFANAIVASMPELPFGGTKNSGFGRELVGERSARVHQRQDLSTSHDRTALLRPRRLGAST